MTAQETFLSNKFSTTLTSNLAAGATTLNVDSTTGSPSVPFLLTVNPENAGYEVIQITGKTATTFTTTAPNRGLDGTTDAAHTSGAVCAVVVVAKHFTDLNDRIDAEVSPITTRGDVITGDASGDEQRVALGTTGQVLTSDGTDAVWGGAVNLEDNTLTRPEFKDWAETIETHVTPGTTETLDLTNGNVQTITLDNATTTTLTFSNPPATGKAGAFTLIVTQSAAGTGDITWPASVDWPDGTAPTLTATASAVDIFTFITTDAGTRWFGMTAGQDFG